MSHIFKHILAKLHYLQTFMDPPPPHPQQHSSCHWSPSPVILIVPTRRTLYRTHGPNVLRIKDMGIVGHGLKTLSQTKLSQPEMTACKTQAHSF